MSRLRFRYAVKKTPKAVALLLGAAAVAVGALIFFSGQPLSFVDSVVQTLIATAGNDYFLVGGIAAVGVLLALIFAFQGRAGTVRQTEMPDAEGAQTVPSPGDGFDGLVRDATGWRATGEREDVRERLREAAIDAVAKAENCSRYEAVNRVDSGGWTADAYAAAVVGGEGSPTLPLVTRLRYAIGGSAFEVAVDRAVDEIETLAGDEDV